MDTSISATRWLHTGLVSHKNTKISSVFAADRDQPCSSISPIRTLGYIDGGVAPIVGDRGFDPLYINPIPSGLVLTGIVVSVSITAFSLALIQRIYRRYGTIEMRELLERAKKEDD